MKATLDPSNNNSPSVSPVSNDRAHLHHRVLERRVLGDHSFVVRMERRAIAFKSGQYISVGVKGDLNMREYSIYSPEQADFVEVLIREVDGGIVSPRLKKLEAGDMAYIEGPFGYFTVEPHMRSAKLFFIASGTGISPFHSMVLSDPKLDYQLIHGVRTKDECYEHKLFDTSRVVSCVSREDGGSFNGRVTSYLRQNKIDAAGFYFLCGNCDMIYEVFDILSSSGVPSSQIFAEVYF